ncbi:MAG: hypothetical protein JST92_25315 [Deltaproteobacteria bacterium]|nr:hypothetical protein [Deltaproteobacteria bacterium]
MTTKTLLVGLALGAALASCTDHGGTGSIVITALAPAFGTADATGTVDPRTCSCDPASKTVIDAMSGARGETVSQCLLLENKLSASSVGGRPDTNGFYVRELHLSYEGITTSVSVPDQIVYYDSFIPSSSNGVIGADMVPEAAAAAMAGASTGTVRVKAQVFGETTDGNSLSSTVFYGILNLTASSSTDTGVCIAGG